MIVLERLRLDMFYVIGVYMMTISRIPVTAEEFSDFNSPPVYKLKGMALTPTEVYIIMILNEVIDTINKMNKGDMNYGDVQD